MKDLPVILLSLYIFVGMGTGATWPVWVWLLVR
jgi:hypothetical protein